MSDLSQALRIITVGIGGVFINLFILMLVLMILGKLFGKKKKSSTN
jgi:Na+-transporting methylmalonyl-CoA/oxaloacetate decarboxylase gamma subunit